MGNLITSQLESRTYLSKNDGSKVILDKEKVLTVMCGYKVLAKLVTGLHMMGVCNCPDSAGFIQVSLMIMFTGIMGACKDGSIQREGRNRQSIDSSL